MKIFVYRLLPIFLCLLSLNSASAAVILQYHHVSDETPPSTSISPAQFEKHMAYIKEQGFTVVPLSDIVTSIATSQPLTKKVGSDKLVAITFDDAYLDIFTHGKPILDKYNYPYTVFVNPGIIESGNKQYMSWQQLKAMAEQNAIIANHGYNHDSLARTPENISEDMWLAQYEHDLMRAEQLIKDNVGQSYRYFAYPYGEFTATIQQWLKQNQFIGFSQQSGAVGISTDLTAIPRFPVSKPYDQLSSLKDKLNSLPFDINPASGHEITLVTHKDIRFVTFDVTTTDFHPTNLNCFISGLGKQEIKWLSDTQFEIEFSDDLPVGRVRCNCTAPSKEKRGRYYWYSKPWFVLKENGSWYPL